MCFHGHYYSRLYNIISKVEIILYPSQVLVYNNMCTRFSRVGLGIDVYVYKRYYTVDVGYVTYYKSFKIHRVLCVLSEC